MTGEPRIRHGASLGGALALDFANTVAWRGTEAERDDLVAWRDVVAWGLRAGVFARAEAAALSGLDAAAAGRALGRARFLRETLHALFSALAAGRPAGRRDLERLNRLLAAAPPRRRLVAAARAGVLSWGRPNGVQGALAPILWSAADILAGAAARQVRLCAGERCGWLFLDPTGRRQWCDMADCGNRAKARRHYHRRRRAADGAMADRKTNGVRRRRRGPPRAA